VALKTAKHTVWIALSLWTGFTFVGYFTPIRDLAHSVLTLDFGPWEWFWIGFYSFATYGNAGWMREQVCKYMCPYARFQGVMFDSDTLIITYDTERGEPRGARSRSADYKAKGLGDCVDCGICVQVCPTGIDIRNGLQYECIGCAACIDGCNQVMAKMGYPKGLIRYSTEKAVKERLAPGHMLRRVLRPRVLVYTAVLWAIIIAAAVTLYGRVPVKVDVIRDRASVVRDLDEPVAENVYRLQIMNTDESVREFTIGVSGLQGMELITQLQPIRLEGASNRVVPVRVRVARESVKPGSNAIEFSIQATEPARPDTQPLVVREKAAFVVQGGS
jgi:cytochrome c oxidase accessory protein FixG